MLRAFGPALLLALVASACAAVQSTVDVTGSPGRPGRGPIAVYYGLAPDFPTQEIGAIQTYGQGPRAHLDDLLEEAEVRARELGAEAIVVRDVRTIARHVPRTEMRPCTRYGVRGMPFHATCPMIVTVLEVDMHLQAVAVRRGPARADVSAPWQAPAVASPTAPWGPPPPPAPVPSAAPPPTPSLPDLDDALSTPP